MIYDMHNCVTEFKPGRESLENDPRSGQPKTSTTSEIVEKDHDMFIFGY